MTSKRKRNEETGSEESSKKLKHENNNNTLQVNVNETRFGWQIKTGNIWQPFPNDVEFFTESAFVDPSSDFFAVPSAGTSRLFCDSCVVSFAEMLRRCVKCGENDVKREEADTNWFWYRQVNDGSWQLYSYSKDIEAAFLLGRETFKIKNGSGLRKRLHLNFRVEQNEQTGTEREIRRRPERTLALTNRRPDYNENVALGHRPKDGLGNATISNAVKFVFPSFWSPMDGSPVILVNLDPNCHEYRFVTNQFLSSSAGGQVTKVERIQNAELWREYVNCKQKMLRRRGLAEGQEDSLSPQSIGSSEPESTHLCPFVNEKFLFHGTSKQFIKPIYATRGFDWRLAGRANGHNFGMGNYFARDSAYSTRFCIDSRTLFMVRVLVGDFTAGKPTYLRPPPLNEKDKFGEVYDSCVDNVNTPSMYVTFEFGQSYPAYLIHF